MKRSNLREKKRKSIFTKTARGYEGEVFQYLEKGDGKKWLKRWIKVEGKILGVYDNKKKKNVLNN